MVRTFLIAASSAAVLTFPIAAFAQQGQSDTADEAKAMLLKAVAAVKADRDVALMMFNKERAGLRTATFMYSVTGSGTGRPSPVRLLSQPARTLGPRKIQPARRMVWNSMPRCRSRKVKSRRLATCCQSRACYRAGSSEGELHHPRGRSRLRRRPLQIDHSTPKDRVGRQNPGAPIFIGNTMKLPTEDNFCVWQLVLWLSLLYRVWRRRKPIRRGRCASL